MTIDHLNEMVAPRCPSVGSFGFEFKVAPSAKGTLVLSNVYLIAALASLPVDDPDYTRVMNYLWDLLDRRGELKSIEAKWLD